MIILFTQTNLPNLFKMYVHIVQGVQIRKLADYVPETTDRTFFEKKYL